MTSLRRSVFLKLAMSFLIFYSAYSALFFLYDCFANMEEYKKGRTIQVLNHLRAGQGMIKTGHFNELDIRLKDAVLDGYVDYYRLQKGDRTLGTRGGERVREEAVRELPADELVHYRDQVFGKIVVGDAELVVASGFGVRDRFTRMWRESRKSIAQDVAFVLICLTLMTLYYFKDLIQLFLSIRRNDRAGIQEIQADSVESELLVRALGGYETHLREAREKNKLLSEQLLPALRKELDSGRAAPYEFECAMVRTDINGFSTIFNTYPREPFMAMIGEFFWSATHVVSRYGGLVHEFAGDEIIFYFKDEGDAARLAASAVRDIAEIAGRFHETSRERGYPFLVKSAIAMGTLRYGKLVNNFTLAGAPFIETVRILSAVQERDRNALLFGRTVRDALQGVCECKFEGRAALKGYKEEMELYSYAGHYEFSAVLQEAKGGNPGALRYFRSDAHVAAALAALELDWSLEAYLGAVAVLRSYACTNAGDEVAAAYKRFLQREVEGDSHYRAASAVALATQLLTPGHIDREIEATLLAALARNDRRVTANVIEVFSWFFPNRQVPELRRFLKDVDNRISANALVKAALERFDDSVIRKIDERVRSGSVAHVASALYAVGEIAAYYKNHDPIYLSTKLRFLRLLDALPELARHPNPMVRRQAITAARKYGDEKLNKRLRAVFEGSADSGLLEVFAAVYGWRRDPAAKAG